MEEVVVSFLTAKPREWLVRCGAFQFGDVHRAFAVVRP